MFLLKILFTLLAILGVWVVFRAVSRVTGGEPPANPGRKDRRSGTGRSVDLVRCPSCGAYHDSGTPCACRNGRNA